MMSKDIHKWTDGRYTLMFDEHTFFVFDNVKEERMTALKTTKRLNEQQATISALKEENEQLRRDNKFLRDERRLQEKGIFTLFDEVNKLNKENENLKIDHRIMGEKLYIMSKDYIKDVGDDDE